MIKAEELRVGNLIRDGHEIIRYGENGTSSFHAVGVVYNFDPIPLTEEILLKCGFEKHDLYPDMVSYKKGLYLLTLNGWFQKMIGPSEATILKQNIKSLHYLQNLYYFLNDEELTVNL